MANAAVRPAKPSVPVSSCHNLKGGFIVTVTLACRSLPRQSTQQTKQQHADQSHGDCAHAVGCVYGQYSSVSRVGPAARAKHRMSESHTPRRARSPGFRIDSDPTVRTDRQVAAGREIREGCMDERWSATTDHDIVLRFPKQPCPCGCA